MTAKEFYENNKGLYFRYNGIDCALLGYSREKLLLAPIVYKDPYEIDWIDQMKTVYSGFRGKCKRIIFANPDELSEINPLNLCELLAGHEGETFYSTIYGDVEIIEVNENWVYFNVGKTHRDAVDKFGRIYEKYPGECTLFPSKENRDWSTYKPKVVLPENSVVMVAYVPAFRLKFYKQGNLCYDGGFDGIHYGASTHWKYIVPIAYYDMNATFEENRKKSII